MDFTCVYGGDSSTNSMLILPLLLLCATLAIGSVDKQSYLHRSLYTGVSQ